MNRPQIISFEGPLTPSRRIAKPTLAQLDLTETGLSLVAQCPDGSFLAVDGGQGTPENKALLWEYLSKKTPEGEKPRIVWFFTHRHPDHDGFAKTFFEEHRGEMDVEVIAINYPNFLTRELKTELPTPEKREILETSSQKLMQIFEENCPDAIIYRPQTGDKLYMPDCEIEIIFTHEDVADVELGWMNDTSTAFRITLGGHTAMIYADCEKISGDYIYKKYGSALKSDIMQVPHHGAGMSSWELYSATDPEICLWEVSKYKFENDSRMLGYKVETAEDGTVTVTDEPSSRFFNAQLRDDSIRARRHYSLSYTTVIDMETLEAQTYGEK